MNVLSVDFESIRSDDYSGDERKISKSVMYQLEWPGGKQRTGTRRSIWSHVVKALWSLGVGRDNPGLDVETRSKKDMDSLLQQRGNWGVQVRTATTRESFQKSSVLRGSLFRLPSGTLTHHPTQSCQGAKNTRGRQALLLRVLLTIQTYYANT